MSLLVCIVGHQHHHIHYGLLLWPPALSPASRHLTPWPSFLEPKSYSTFPLLKTRRSVSLLLGQRHDPCTQRARPPRQLHLPYDGPSSSSTDWLRPLPGQGALSPTPWNLTALLLLVSLSWGCCRKALLCGGKSDFSGGPLRGSSSDSWCPQREVSTFQTKQFHGLH